jgi:hypothetical protein
MLNFICPNRPLSQPPFGALPDSFVSLLHQALDFGEIIGTDEPGFQCREIYGARFTLWETDLQALASYYHEAPGYQAIQGFPVYAKSPQTVEAILGDASQIVQAALEALTSQNPSLRHIFVSRADTRYLSAQVMIRDHKIQLLLSAPVVEISRELGKDAVCLYEEILLPLAESLKLPIGGLHFAVSSLTYRVRC